MKRHTLSILAALVVCLSAPLHADAQHLTDLKEERDVLIYNSWVPYPMTKILGEFEASLKKYPPIKPGTPDPYVP